MSRFINPHQVYQLPQQNNQQNIQMVPVNTPTGIQMMPAIVMPNGQVQLINNQSIPTPSMPMQPNMFGQSNMFMQPNVNMQNNMPMYPNVNMQPNIVAQNNRFQQVTVPQGITNNFTNTAQETDSRFNAPATFLPNTEVSDVKADKTFTVTLLKDTTHALNELVKITTYINEIKDNHVTINNSKYIAVDCFNEAVECIIELGNSNSKIITAQNYIINNIFYKVSMLKELDDLFKSNIKSVYKTLKGIFPRISNKYDLNMFIQFDRILKDYINEYIAINHPDEIYIDSFITDFNDLLKVIRNTTIDLEDNLVDSINAYLAKISSCDNESFIKEFNTTFCIPEIITFVYIDKLLAEIGLQELNNTFIKVDVNPANIFINSLGKYICDKLITEQFILVTIDKEIIKFAQDITGNIWLKKLS